MALSYQTVSKTLTYWYCQMKKKRMIMKILKKEWFIWKFWKKGGGSREKGRRKRNPCPMRLWWVLVNPELLAWSKWRIWPFGGEGCQVISWQVRQWTIYSRLHVWRIPFSLYVKNFYCRFWKREGATKVKTFGTYSNPFTCPVLHRGR
jgi:hypothetical protein